MYRNHTICRACGFGKDPNAPGIKVLPNRDKLIPVFDLGVQPLANDFKKEGEACAGYFPLKVMYCPRCSLAQLSVVVDPEVMYANYSYVTSKSDMMKEHFGKLWGAIVEERHPRKILEVGSNDGDFLHYAMDHGAALCVGVDPATNLAKIAKEQGIQTVPLMFNEITAKTVAGWHQSFDVIVARHVFCHIDDWQGFIRACELVSDEDTLVVIEAPYVGDTLMNCEFDQCYHEHMSFLSYKAVDALLAKSKFQIVSIQRYGIHGGTSALFLRNREMDFPTKQLVREFIATENITAEDWKKFGVEARDQINRLSQTVRSAVAQGKRVVGLGASAKSTVWVNACGFTKREVAFIADNTPQKQLTFSPGTDIPIVDEGAILRELPDYVILWAWNYKDEILAKFDSVRKKGVKFIIPVPTITVV